MIHAMQLERANRESCSGLSFFYTILRASAKCSGQPVTKARPLYNRAVCLLSLPSSGNRGLCSVYGDRRWSPHTSAIRPWRSSRTERDQQRYLKVGHHRGDLHDIGLIVPRSTFCQQSLFESFLPDCHHLAGTQLRFRHVQSGKVRYSTSTQKHIC